MSSNQTEFINIISDIANKISSKPLDNVLASFLNQEYAKNSSIYQKLKNLCQIGEDEHWLVNREMAGVKFGRIIKPNTIASVFSVDVVKMKNIVGPHHIHTNGEIGLMIALEGEPLFDNYAEPWYVYPIGSAHFPTITNGEAYIIYFLPQGAIEFTGKPIES